MTFLIWALTTGAITCAVWAGLVAWDRDQKRRLAAREARALELDRTRRAVAELESRVEFAERLLGEQSAERDRAR